VSSIPFKVESKGIFRKAAQSAGYATIVTGDHSRAAPPRGYETPRGTTDHCAMAGDRHGSPREATDDLKTSPRVPRAVGLACEPRACGAQARTAFSTGSVLA
jgi:hypothetical protein